MNGLIFVLEFLIQIVKELHIIFNLVCQSFIQFKQLLALLDVCLVNRNIVTISGQSTI